jgi:hypothetical protein
MRLDCARFQHHTSPYGPRVHSTSASPTSALCSLPAPHVVVDCDFTRHLLRINPNCACFLYLTRLCGFHLYVLASQHQNRHWFHQHPHVCTLTGLASSISRVGADLSLARPYASSWKLSSSGLGMSALRPSTVIAPSTARQWGSHPHS